MCGFMSTNDGRYHHLLNDLNNREIWFDSEIYDRQNLGEINPNRIYILTLKCKNQSLENLLKVRYRWN